MAHLYSLAFGAVTTLGMLVVFTAVQRVVAPGHTFRAEVDGKNPARALLHVGNLAAIFMMGSSVVAGCVQGESVAEDAAWVALFGALSLAVFAGSARLGVHAMLGRTLPAELDRGNVAAGVAAGAYSIATGIVVAKSMNGTDAHTAFVAVVFFALSQASMHGLVMLYRALTSYDDDDEIKDQNVAAALSYAGLTIAVALLVGRAVEGHFQGWGPSLRGFAFALGYAFILYPVRQIVVEGLLLGSMPRLRAGRLDHAVGRERSLGMGALEAAAYIATALVINRVG